MTSETEKLLSWFDAHKRALPWRGVGDPYKIWLSEIMLQQTTVKAVIPYYEKFIARWDTVEALALAPLDDVLAAWAGLGYYSRARNLHDCARQILQEYKGFFPQTAAELLKLKGIGAYTSAAIASIAFKEPIAVVDGNVERVFGRCFMLSSMEEVRASVQAHVPASRAGDFAESLMDLGATICTPKNPACGLCPLNSGCLARLNGETTNFPIKKARVKPLEKRAVCFVIENDLCEILLERRASAGLLGGMWGLPTSSWVLEGEFDLQIALNEAPLLLDYSVQNEVVRHIFTHIALEMTIVKAHFKGSAPASMQFKRDLSGLPRLFSKIFSQDS